MTSIKKDATVRPICWIDEYSIEGRLFVSREEAESRIQELEEARNKHWRGEEIAVRQLEIVKAQAEALSNALKRIEKNPDCGCHPVHRCQSAEAIKIELDGIRELATEALSAYRTANPDKGE